MDNLIGLADRSGHEHVSAIQAIAQEAYVFSAGIGKGIVAEVQKDPQRAVEGLAVSAISGGALGLVVAAELPVISTAALAVGAYCTGKFLVDELSPYTEHNKVRNLAIADAWNTAATTLDQRKLQYRIDELSSKCSQDSFAFFQAATALSASRLGAEIPALSRNIYGYPALQFSSSVAEGMRPRFEDVKAFEDFVNFQKSLHGPVVTKFLSDELVKEMARAKEPTEPIKAEEAEKLLPEPHGGEKTTNGSYMDQRYGKFHRKN